MRSRQIRRSRSFTRGSSLANASPFSSAKRAIDTTPPRTEGPTAEAIAVSTEAAALPEETVTVAPPRSATTARSPVTSPESAASADVPAADPTSKNNLNVSHSHPCLVVVVVVVAAEAASEEAVTSAVTAEVAAISIVIDAQDIAAAEAVPTTGEMREREVRVVTESEQATNRYLSINMKLANVENIKMRRTT